MSFRIFGEDPIGSKATRRRDSRNDLFSFNFGNKKKRPPTIKLEPESSGEEEVGGGNEVSLLPEPEQPSPVSRKSGMTRTRTPSARVAVAEATQSLMEKDNANGKGSSKKGKENRGQGSRAPNPKRRLTDNTYFNTGTTTAVVEDVEEGPAPTKKLKVKREPQQPPKKKSGGGGGGRASAPASLPVQKKNKKSESQGAASKASTRKKANRKVSVKLLDSESDDDRGGDDILSPPKVQKKNRAYSLVYSESDAEQEEDSAERPKSTTGGASPPKKTKSLGPSNELELSGVAPYLEDVSDAPIQATGMPDKKGGPGPSTSKDKHQPSAGLVPTSDTTDVVSGTESGSRQAAAAPSKLNLNPVVLLERLPPGSINRSSSSSILATDSDDEEEAVLVISEDVENYNQLRNSDLTHNAVAFPKQLLKHVASFITPEMSTLREECPGVGRTVTTVTDSLKLGYLAIDPKTIRPLDCSDNYTIIYWVITGSITLRSSGGFYSKPDGESHINYLFGKSLDPGTAIVVPPQTAFFIENWGEDKALLGYSLSSQ